MKQIQLIFIGYILLGCAKPQTTIETIPLISNTDALLQAISIVDKNVAWVSGHKATFVRTTDGGINWRPFHYPNDTLQFRDIHSFDHTEAVIMSAGPGKLSRIFKFSDHSGFREVYVMPHEEGFLNTIEFWDNGKGLAFGDSFNGQLFVLITNDKGETWERIDPSTLPPAGKGEGGFAASGACISLLRGGRAWIGTGAGGHSRVLFTDNFGRTWSDYEVPIVKGDAAGITSIHMVDLSTGLIAGGDLAITGAYTDNIAITDDGGKTWTLAGQPITKGAFYGSDIIRWKNDFLMIMCGPKGIDYSDDHGHTFNNLDTLNYWAVDLHKSGSGYAVGTDGKLLKLIIH
ncbi:MAG: hypothetical protein RIC35_02685 [Marinoscillum sp.]